MKAAARCLALVVVMAVALSGFPGLAADGAPVSQTAAQTSPNGGIMLADVLIARPMGIAACVVGLAGTVIALPFAAFSGSVHAVIERLVTEPFAYTFQRPVGQFPEEVPSR
ncbi:multidrug transporter [Desulfosoma sp.]